MTKKNTLLYVMLVGMFQLMCAQDVSLVEADLARYALKSESNTIYFSVKNNGASEITSLELNWNDGSDHRETVRTSIPSGDIVVVAHPTPVRYSTVVEKDINVAILKANGVSDLDASNNTTSLKFNTVSRAAQKAVLFEKGTGTWCQACPAGIVMFKNMYKKHKGTFIGSAVHKGDPMKYPDYIGSMGINGYPKGNVDRSIKNQVFMDEEKAEGWYEQRMKVEAPADLSASVVADGAKIKVKTKAKFYSDFRSAKFKLALIITEDNVRGTSSGYAQTNGFANNKYGPMGGFEKLPSPVPASKMVYDHVARVLVGGYNGKEGSVPSTIKSGQEVEYTFNHTLPKSETKNYNLIIVLIDNRGSVANAKEIKLEEALSVGEVDATFASLKMYPNPAKEQLNIAFDAVNENYTVVIYDMLGREVIQKEYNTVLGKQTIAVPVSELKSGSYIASISSGKSSYSQAVIIE